MERRHVNEVFWRREYEVPESLVRFKGFERTMVDLSVRLKARVREMLAGFPDAEIEQSPWRQPYDAGVFRSEIGVRFGCETFEERQRVVAWETDHPGGLRVRVDLDGNDLGPLGSWPDRSERGLTPEERFRREMVCEPLPRHAQLVGGAMVYALSRLTLEEIRRLKALMEDRSAEQLLKDFQWLASKPRGEGGDR